VNEDGTLLISDVASGALRGRLKQGHPLYGVEFSRDKALLLVVGYDSTSVWNVADQKFVGPPILHSGRVRSAHFNTDASKLVTAASDHAVIWESKSGKKLWTFNYSNDVREAAFSPDGTKIVVASSDIAEIWDATDADGIAILKHEQQVDHVEFAPDGKTVLT